MTKNAKNKFCKRPIAPGISRQSPIQVLTGPALLNFRDETRTAAFNAVWSYAKDSRLGPGCRDERNSADAEECQKLRGALARRLAVGSTSREVRRVHLDVGLKVAQSESWHR